MKTIATITRNLKESKLVQKKTATLSCYSEELFIEDAKAYIKAIKEGRMFCNIGRVSSSGMSRTISFKSCEKGKHDKRYYFRNYVCLFICLDYLETKDKDGYFRISGCGMDMVFHTNYSIIHSFERLGLMTKKECERLRQMTPRIM